MVLKFDDVCAKTVEEVCSYKCELNWVALKYEGKDKDKIMIGDKQKSKNCVAFSENNTIKLNLKNNTTKLNVMETQKNVKF